MKDHCTGFFEHWLRYGKDLRIEVFYLGELCKEHDKDCDNMKFFKLLYTHRVVGATLIGTAATLGCWIKYPIQMLKRI